MKKVLFRVPISPFTYRFDRKEREEIEYYDDGSSSIVCVFYRLKE